MPAMTPGQRWVPLLVVYRFQCCCFINKLLLLLSARFCLENINSYYNFLSTDHSTKVQDMRKTASERTVDTEENQHESGVTEPVVKPTSKYRPPGGVPFMGGAMGGLIAEMKLKQNDKGIVRNLQIPDL